MIAIIYPGGNNGPGGVDLPSRVGGVIVLMLWAVIPAALDVAITLNRDIT